MSAVTIPDMVRIIEHHQLVPVPVDVDGPTLQPVLEHFERSITPRTRAILVAHLFGTHIEMGPIVELARQHDLLVIEDCAQAFVGSAYAGHPDSDCALFSFGPIKTATALGGAVVRVRDAELRSRMRDLQNAYPMQSRSAYLKRLVKYCDVSDVVQTVQLRTVSSNARHAGHRLRSGTGQCGPFVCRERFLYADPPAAEHTAVADDRATNHRVRPARGGSIATPDDAR